MAVEINIDEQSARHLDKQFEILKAQAGRSLYSAIVKLAFKIKSEAQMRLRGQKHIVTSRLRNSLFVKANPPQYMKGNAATYTDEPPKDPKLMKRWKQQTFDSDLKSVSVSETELAVGTNVEYATKIEVMDSYLYWAMKNVDVEQSVTKDMKDFMKFGTGVLPAPDAK